MGKYDWKSGWHPKASTKTMHLVGVHQYGDTVKTTCGIWISYKDKQGEAIYYCNTCMNIVENWYNQSTRGM